MANEVGTSIVTGAGRGIGRAIAKRLASEGLSVLVNDLDPAVVDEVVEEIRTLGGSAAGAIADVSSPGGANELVESALSSFGGLDVVVNNAGITRDAMVHRMSDDEWSSVISVNLTGVFNLCRASFGALRSRVPGERNGKVINIASINGIYGTVANANYSAAKAGVIGLTKTLAREWGPKRINVNAIAPGYIAGTRMTAPRGEGDAIGIPPEIIDRIEATIPIGRPGTPDDVAGVAAFLAGADSDYLTGQVIELHGGLEFIQVV